MIRSTPQVPVTHSISKLMLHVGYALIPGVAAYVWFFGVSILAQIALACVTAIVSESIVLGLRKRPLAPSLLDGSALITAVLLALAIPSIAPWWVIVLGTAFAIIFGKQLFGGLGYNPFNPAMLGYVMLLISFPLEMTTWPAIQNGLDSITAATPLDALKTQLGQGIDIPSAMANPEIGNLFGMVAGIGWEAVSVGFLLGGLYLLVTGRIAWQIPVSMLATLTVLSTLFYLIDPARYADPLLHLFGGATMLGAFFIATDPVSAATTPRGRLIYGAGIAAFSFIIRSWGGYPEGLAFAVLLMNMAAPTIDHYTRPRAFGEQRGKD